MFRNSVRYVVHIKISSQVDVTNMKKIIKILLIIAAMAIHSTTTLNLYCNFYFFTWTTVEIFYSCRVEIVSITAVNEVIESVTGTHVKSYETSNVKIVEILDQKCNYLPCNLSKHFPQLQGLFVRNSFLKEILKSNFEKLTELQFLDFESNHLTTLNSDIFSEMPNLESINLENNNIAIIEIGVFNNLPNLKKINLNGNLCISDTFISVQTIEELKQIIAIKCTTKTKILSIENQYNIQKPYDVYRATSPHDFTTNEQCDCENVEKECPSYNAERSLFKHWLFQLFFGFWD